MAHIVPYINFADKGSEALEFYKQIFGGDAKVTYVKDSPMADQMPAEWGERIFHLDYTAGEIHFLGSDIISDQQGKELGNTYALALVCDSDDQVGEYFDKLKVGGEVTMEPAPSGWGSVFAQCTDRYGIKWMLDSSQA